MDKKLLGELLASVGQAGAVLRGESNSPVKNPFRVARIAVTARRFTQPKVCLCIFQRAAKPSRVARVESVPSVRRIRTRLKLSQAEFALVIGVPKKTVQNWEQGIRTPEGPARALLRVAAKRPDAILEALHPRLKRRKAV